MWNLDIETRIRELDREADDRQARLLDTMTETDGSAKSGHIALARIVERIKNALGTLSSSSKSAGSYPGSIVSGK